MISRVYLVRHGQTAWNVGEIFRGRADIPLDETGRQEVHLAGEALKNETLHAIYSSPLSRSMETAENIAKFHNLPVTPLDAIIDISYGEWEGTGNQEIQQKYPELMRSLEQLLAKHRDENFVLVAHRVPNKVICCSLLGLDNSHFWRIQQDTACTNLFTYQDGQWNISFLNDTSYLRSLEKEPLADF
jgi:broad specificity phosphatase PhoE